MKIKFRKRHLFLVLAFSSAIIAAMNSGVDSIAGDLMNNYWVLSISCFILGFIVSLLFSCLLSIPIKGKSIGSQTFDPSFNRIRLITKQEIAYHALAGLGNSIMTIGYFALFYDPNLGRSPAAILPFAQVVILYLVVAESITEKDTPTLVEIQSALIVTFGAILGSISLSGTISVRALAIVFLIINPGSMLFSFYQRKLKMIKIKDKPNDSINIRLWNVVFALIFTSIITLCWSLYDGTNYLFGGLTASINYFGWLFIMATGTFFSFVFYIRALGIGKASIAQAVKSTVIIFSIPVTIVLSYYGYVDPFTTDPTLLIIKAIGMILMILGIISFTVTLAKSYVFIKVKPGYSIEDTMQKLWKIKGVNRVCAVAGPYDFVVKIHTRTFVKGYERIIRKIAELPSIKEYKMQSVLKEWENI